MTLATHKLTLTRKRTFAHYLDPLIMAAISLFFIFLILKGFVEKEGNYNSPYILIFLFFPIVSVLFFINQRRLLQLKQINTNFSKHTNYHLVKETLKVLSWHVKVDNKSFIEAYTDNFGFWTWTDQMISVFIADNKILFNSIGNVDNFAAQHFLGDNT